MKKHEWSDEDSLILEDAIADGWPGSAIARRLGCSQAAVFRRASVLGLKLSRRDVVDQMTLHLEKTARARLTSIAAARGVTFGVLCRIVLEVASRTPIFLDQLLDDQDRHILAVEEPLTQNLVDNSEPSPPVPPAAVPLSMQPMLEARLA